MLDAPVEWVPGDRFWSRIFTLYWWTLVAVALALVSVTAYNTLVLFGVVQGSPWPPVTAPGWILLLLVPLLILMGPVLKGHRPVAGAIGISPRGLLLPSFHRKNYHTWNRMRWIDAIHLYVEVGMGYERVQLTPQQAHRIRHFFGQG